MDIKRTLAKVWRIVVGTWRQMQQSDAQLLAGSLAFSSVMSLVPLLAVSLSVFKAYGGFEPLLEYIEPFLIENLVEESGEEVSLAIRSAIERVHSGALGVGGALALLFAATKLLYDMETAIQRVWGVKAPRPLLQRLLVYWALIFFGPILLAVALGLLGSRGMFLIDRIPHHAIAFGVSMFLFTFIYKVIPAVRVNLRPAVFSAAVATIAVAVGQSFYAKITGEMLSYSKIYGSLASVPIFLLWILILWWICLGGAALGATLQQERNLKGS
jgi:membrane protein